MSAYAMSVGEPECSQDTPLKKPRLKAANIVKQPKLNQCQTVFKIIATSRSMEDKFDPTFDAIDKDLSEIDNGLNDMNKELDNERASMREAAEENDDLLPLIQEFAEKSTATKKANDHLVTEVAEFCNMIGNQSLSSADINMPDYDSFQDDMVIRECAEAHKERSAALKSALENHQRAKQQVEGFRVDLQQVREEVAAALRRVREEYEARLSQQRKELDEKYKQKKADLVQKLSERQQVTEQTAEPSRPHQVELDDACQAGKATADTELEKLQFRLRETQLDLREAQQAGKTSKEQLYSQQVRHDKALLAQQEAYEELQAELEYHQEDYKETKLKLERKFDKAEESKITLGDSLYKYMAKTKRLRSEIEEKQEVIDEMAQTAANDIHKVKVALAEDSNLRIEQLQGAHEEHILNLSEEHQRQLQAAQSVFHQREEKMRADFKISQDQYAQASGHETSLLRMKLNAEKTSLWESSRKKLQIERENSERKLRDLKIELTAQRMSELQEQRDSDHGQHVLDRIHMKQTWRRKLKEQLTTEWSCKLTDADARIKELSGKLVAAETAKNVLCGQKKSLEDDSKSLQLQFQRQNETTTELEAQVEAKDHLLASATTELSSKKREIQSLKDELSKVAGELTSERSLISGKVQRIGELEAAKKNQDKSTAQLRYDLSLRDTNLNTQISVRISQNERIQRLEEANRDLLQRQSETDKAMEGVKAKLSNLKLSNDAKQNELTSQSTLIAQRNDRVRGLEATNADLLRAQEEAKKEKVRLQTKLKIADGKTDNLEKTLKARDEELSTATEETNGTRRRLEEVEKDLSAEKSANMTASLESLLEDAKGTTDTLSTDLRNERWRLEEERLKNTSLSAMIDRLDEENLSLSEGKDISDKRNKELDEALSLDKDTIHNLQAEAASNSLLLDQLQTDRDFYDDERACILRQLMAESTRLHCMEGELPQDLAWTLGNVQDVRMFSGVQAGETVLVRAQMFRRERKAFIIVQKDDHTRIVWHDDLERCTVNVVGWRGYLRLDNRPDEAQIEVCIDGDLAHDLKNWLRVSGSVASGFNK